MNAFHPTPEWQAVRTEHFGGDLIRVTLWFPNRPNQAVLFRIGEYSMEAVERAAQAILSDTRVNPGNRVAP